MVKMKHQFYKDVKSLSLILVLKKIIQICRDLCRNEKSDDDLDQNVTNQSNEEKSQRD